MSDILKQIQALQEQFSNLFEDSVKKAERRNLDKSIKADHKEAKELKKKIRDCWTRHSCYLSPSAKSETINNERIGYVRKLKKLIADGNQKLQKRDELNKEEAVKAGKENKATNKSETHKFSLTNEEFVQQIMDLKEAFSNLFEVEGLGNPAVDVPPSQNKIKKDVKTKDGKAELVSVEDELFPYDGNKREQYRQKILDTINGMIQGTSTLEDLLQIVRQKKAPLKEAMEVLEELTKEDEKAAQKALDRHFDKVLYKPLKKQANITRKAVATEKFKRMNSEALKEAVELMEDLFSTILKQPDEKQGALVYKYHQAKNKENAGKDTYTQAKEEEKRKSKEEKGQEKTEQRKKYKGKSVEDWKLGRLMDQIARNAKNLGKVEDSATAKAVRRNAQKADLKEALEIMEAIINEVSMDKWKEAAASSLPKRQEKALKSEEEGKQIWKDYEEASKKSPEDEPSLYRKAEKDAEAHAEEHKKNVDRASQAELVSMLKTKGKSANKTIKAAKKVQDERSEDFYENPNAKTLSRKVKASSVAAADPVKSRNEAD